MNLWQNRKGAGGGIGAFGEHWSEGFTVLLLVFSLFISLFLIRSAFLAYCIAFILGFASGRYLEMHQWRFPYFLIILGLLIGFIVGMRFGSRKIAIFLFIIGTWLSIWLHRHDKIK
ncbi:MAG TPA: hypothetical protein VJK52_03025 [Candidatus Nanoarchaeia archaeon]|nr:hypothetical protein [Candidatus Nanoarchaeia archaeon]